MATLKRLLGQKALDRAILEADAILSDYLLGQERERDEIEKAVEQQLQEVYEAGKARLHQDEEDLN